MTWARPCVHEDAVRQMARRGREDERLLAHAAMCAECRDSLEAAALMRDLAALPAPASDRTAPSASYLWWKAELLRRWDAEQRAVEPVEIGERLGAGLGVIGAVAILIWLWQRVDLSQLSLLRGADSAALSWLMAGIGVLCVLVLGATAMAVFDVGGRDRKD